MENHTIPAYELKKMSSLTLMSYICYQFLFHTLFQCNDTRAQNVSLVSHKNAFYHVKVQNCKRKRYIYTFQNLLKRAPKIKEIPYLAM